MPWNYGELFLCFIHKLATFIEEDCLKKGAMKAIRPRTLLCMNADKNTSWILDYVNNMCLSYIKKKRFRTDDGNMIDC